MEVTAIICLTVVIIAGLAYRLAMRIASIEEFEGQCAYIIQPGRLGLSLNEKRTIVQLVKEHFHAD